MNKKYIKTLVSLALTEDVGAGDITTNALVSKEYTSSAHIIVKTPGLICGIDFAKEAFRQLDHKVKFESLVNDGNAVKSGTIIARVHGLSRALLTGERVALNFLSYLSGIATKTHAFVTAVKPYKTAIMDTRKTTPLLRRAERYAVECGGGVNHRFDLSNMAMIKDNHRMFATKGKTLIDLVDLIKSKNKALLELEVDTLNELKQALGSKADIILLDNMTPVQIRNAIALRAKVKSKVLFEASGGIDLNNVLQYAATGVERISIGALTHSRLALDVSLEFLS